MNDKRYPKLRPVQTQWVDLGGGKAGLLLQDRLALGARAVVVPEVLAPLLALCDGTRTPAGIRASLELRTGLNLDLPTVEAALDQLDGALLLENERYAEAYQQALESYRSAPFRPPALAAESYPDDPADLTSVLDSYLQAAAGVNGHLSETGRVRGLICPHIDYERGGPVYARLWDRAREAVAETDLFIVVGTDHAGGPAEITLTRQSYGTPFGILRTDVNSVDRVAKAMGEDSAYGSELNHAAEHSIELVAVWLHRLVGARDVRILPVLCGSFYPFTQSNGRPDQVLSWRAGAEALGKIAHEDHAMVIAAADLAHVGPAFGSPTPVQAAEKQALTDFDTRMLRTVTAGDGEAFLDLLIKEQDRYNVCGLPPIYLTMSMLGKVRGEVVAYSQCPAPGESVVSITGMMLYEENQATSTSA